MVNTTSGVKTICASLLCAVFDLVAKAPALNMKQFLYPGIYVFWTFHDISS